MNKHQILNIGSPNNGCIVTEITGRFNQQVFIDDIFDIPTRAYGVFFYKGHYYHALSSPFYFHDVIVKDKLLQAKNHIDLGSTRLFLFHTQNVLESLSMTYVFSLKFSQSQKESRYKVALDYHVYSPILFIKQMSDWMEQAPCTVEIKQNLENRFMVEAIYAETFNMKSLKNKNELKIEELSKNVQKALQNKLNGYRLRIDNFQFISYLKAYNVLVIEGVCYGKIIPISQYLS